VATLLASNLDAYSRFALPLILARFPEWESDGAVQPRPDGEGVTVEFNIPCPNQATEMSLWVSTAEEELTVGFHTHHDHFTDYDTRLSADQIGVGLDLAVAYLEDRRGVVSWYQGDRLAGTTNCNLPLSGPIPRIFSQLPVSLGTLRSWSGRFDRDEPNATNHGHD
jgi:hypothetical protein